MTLVGYFDSPPSPRRMMTWSWHRRSVVLADVCFSCGVICTKFQNNDQLLVNPHVAHAYQLSLSFSLRSTANPGEYFHMLHFSTGNTGTVCLLRKVSQPSMLLTETRKMFINCTVARIVCRECRLPKPNTASFEQPGKNTETLQRVLTVLYRYYIVKFISTVMQLLD